MRLSCSWRDSTCFKRLALTQVYFLSLLLLLSRWKAVWVRAVPQALQPAGQAQHAQPLPHGREAAQVQALPLRSRRQQQPEEAPAHPLRRAAVQVPDLPLRQPQLQPAHGAPPLAHRWVESSASCAEALVVAARGGQRLIHLWFPCHGRLEEGFAGTQRSRGALMTLLPKPIRRDVIASLCSSLHTKTCDQITYCRHPCCSCWSTSSQ